MDSKQKKMAAGAAVLCGLFAILGSAYAYAYAGGDAILPGITVAGMDVSGMSAAEAQQAVDAYVSRAAEKKMTLQVDEHAVEVTFAELGLKAANTEVVDEAAAIGRTGGFTERISERMALKNAARAFDIAWTADEEKIVSVVEGKCSAFDKEAADAQISFADGTFAVAPGQSGLKLDAVAAKREILEFIENGFAAEDAALTLETEVIEPEWTDSELSKVKDVLGTFTTSYSTSNANRSKNVANGCSLINGTWVYPGEVFSTYETVSPFEKENGYELAGSYLNGKTVESYGGGICQVSTTLYNAVLRAELEVVERANHSMIVGYVDPSADAAISGTYKDFKFRNNSDYPIYIEGVTTGDKHLTFTIYGAETRPASHSVKYVSKTLSSTEATTKLIADGGHGIGYVRTESGHRGLKAELYKYTYENGKEVSVELVNESTYMMSPKTVTFGVAGTPEQSAQMMAAIASGDEGLVRATAAACMAQPLE